VLEQIAVEIAEALRCAATPSLEVIGQDDAEVIVAHRGREVVADHAIAALAARPVGDGGVQDLNQRERFVIRAVLERERGRDDLQIQHVVITLGIVPLHQRIEPVIDHHQRVAQILLAAFPTRKIGEVGGNTRVVGRTIILVEGQAADRECEPAIRMTHPGFAGGRSGESAQGVNRPERRQPTDRRIKGDPPEEPPSEERYGAERQVSWLTGQRDGSGLPRLLARTQ